MSFNVHGLLHLTDDAKRYGSLDYFSAFKFENKLYELKRLLKSGRQPLQQIHRRLMEKESLPLMQEKTLQLCTHPHNDFEVPQAFKEYAQFGRLHLKGFELANIGPDSYCIMRDNIIVKIKNFLKKGQLVIVRGFQFNLKQDLFSSPTTSGTFQVFKCCSISETIRSFDLCNIACKCIALPISIESYAIFPILHSI